METKSKNNQTKNTTRKKHLVQSSDPTKDKACPCKEKKAFTSPGGVNEYILKCVSCGLETSIDLDRASKDDVYTLMYGIDIETFKERGLDMLARWGSCLKSKFDLPLVYQSMLDYRLKEEEKIKPKEKKSKKIREHKRSASIYGVNIHGATSVVINNNVGRYNLRSRNHGRERYYQPCPPPKRKRVEKKVCVDEPILEKSDESGEDDNNNDNDDIENNHQENNVDDDAEDVDQEVDEDIDEDEDDNKDEDEDEDEEKGGDGDELENGDEEEKVLVKKSVYPSDKAEKNPIKAEINRTYVNASILAAANRPGSTILYFDGARACTSKAFLDAGVPGTTELLVPNMPDYDDVNKFMTFNGMRARVNLVKMWAHQAIDMLKKRNAKVVSAWLDFTGTLFGDSDKQRKEGNTSPMEDIRSMLSSGCLENGSVFAVTLCRRMRGEKGKGKEETMALISGVARTNGLFLHLEDQKDYGTMFYLRYQVEKQDSIIGKKRSRDEENVENIENVKNVEKMLAEVKRALDTLNGIIGAVAGH